MCGIVGVFRKDGLVPEDHGRMNNAMERLRLRGPDASGVWEDARLLLGHTRLIIVDPETGQQPWMDEPSGVVLVYNGEIYNFREIRAVLERRGHLFNSTCDTEVLMRAYLEWGEACLERLRGMFAFVIFDPRVECLWLVRDRLGVKPLYYYQDAGSYFFSSSLSGLRVLVGRSFEWDEDAVSHYLLTARTELGSRTLIRDFCALEPGSSLRIDLRAATCAIERYWQMPCPSAAEKLDLSDSELVERCRTLLSSAVSEQLLTSDVPVGGFLSGGLDSAILCREISEKKDYFTAYSIGYERARYNEWEAMECTAEANRLNWQRVEAEEDDFWEDWRWLISNRGTALSTPNEIPIFRMAKAFSKDCKVALTGEGADEIFGGYAGPTFCAFDFDRSQGLGGSVSATALDRGYGVEAFRSRREHFLSANSWFGLSEMRQILPGLAAATCDFSDLLAWYDAFFAGVEPLTTFDAYLHLHARVNLEGLLNRLDSSTMGASVEGRVPFTDHRLVEFMFSLPDEQKMFLRKNSDGLALRELNAFELDVAGAIETKTLLRRAYKGQVPDPILRRKKVSFPVPFVELLAGPLRARLDEVLESAPKIQRLLGITEITGVLSDVDTKSSLRAWLLVNLALLEAEVESDSNAATK